MPSCVESYAKKQISISRQNAFYSNVLFLDIFNPSGIDRIVLDITRETASY